MLKQSINCKILLMLVSNMKQAKQDIIKLKKDVKVLKYQVVEHGCII